MGAPTATRKQSDRPTVLIVDDYDDVRPLIRRWLEDFGCRVVEASGGKEAVEVAKREHPNLILMDLFMPEVDGYAAAFRIRRDEELKDVPIVAISAYGELGIDAQAQIDPQAVGFNEYVPKPFGPERLKELLDRFLPRSKTATTGE